MISVSAGEDLLNSALRKLDFTYFFHFSLFYFISLLLLIINSLTPYNQVKHTFYTLKPCSILRVSLKIAINYSLINQKLTHFQSIYI